MKKLVLLAMVAAILCGILIQAVTCDEGSGWLSTLARLKPLYLEGYSGFRLITAESMAAFPLSRYGLREGDRVAISGNQLTDRGQGWADIYENNGGVVKVALPPTMFDVNRPGHGVIVLGTIRKFDLPTKWWDGTGPFEYYVRAEAIVSVP